MFDIAAALELIPAPSTVAELAGKLVVGPWPRSDAERQELFTRLGFQSRHPDQLETGKSPHQLIELETNLDGQPHGSWSTYKEQLLGITFFLYGSQEPGAPIAQHGFTELQIELTKLFGKPSHPWDDEESPPCIWECNGRTITTHLFNRRDSVVKFSVEDSALAADASATA